MNSALSDTHSLDTAEEVLYCFHCGQPCSGQTIRKYDKSFCCFGCQAIFEILDENNLCEYYSLHAAPGSRNGEKNEAGEFDYLNDAAIRKQVVVFDSPDLCKVDFYVPAIHCISCLWLLENFSRLCPGIIRSQVVFSSKRAIIEFNPTIVTLGEVASKLSSIGYRPHIQQKKSKTIRDTTTVSQLAVAGFAFGNCMLLSFPEYLGLDATEESLAPLFSYLNIALAIPVLLYSASHYFRSSWTGLRQRNLTVDIPIAFGLAALFFRSTYDVVFHVGPGYFDSFTGLVFFLLIGRWFQDKTYETLAFDRDYGSYLPLAIQKLAGGSWKSTLIYELRPGDIIRIRNREVVPADAQLHSPRAYIDYSFVTGESRPVEVKAGDTVHAGGRLVGTPIVLTVEKATAQSHLTSLWNSPAFQKEKRRNQLTIDVAARWFTGFVLLFSAAVGVYWYVADPDRWWLIFTSVLIVACPCALALAAPFTHGNMLRVFGRHGFYLRNTDVLEQIAAIDSVVFDKTGTITHNKASVQFTGNLSAEEQEYVASLAATSTHPLSERVAGHFKRGVWPVANVVERPGKGIEGDVHGQRVKIGSAAFVNTHLASSPSGSQVFVSINDQLRGYFDVTMQLRDGIEEVVDSLSTRPMALLSGDGEGDRVRMSEIFPATAELLFNQSPQEKMEFIKNWKSQGRRVMMIGDGLNDAGALQASDIGVAVSDHAGLFTPACDGILKGDSLPLLPVFIRLARTSVDILKVSFAVSFLYNFISLGIAASGHLSPLVAAIIMPLSSISVVGLSSALVALHSRKLLKS